MKNTLKKVLCLALVALMVLGLAACGDVGKYELEYAVIDGNEYTVEDLAALGLDLDGSYIELEFGGKGEMELMGEESTFEWKDGEIWDEDDEDDVIEYEIDGDELSIEAEGVTFVFVKD